MITDDIVFGLQSAIEDALLNGSTLLNDLDNAVGGSELWTSNRDARNSWEGVRKSAVTSGVGTVDASTFDIGDLRTARKNMGKYAVDTSNLVWLVGPTAYSKFLGLTEVLTLEKFGPRATVLTGQIGAVDGVPIVLSEYIYENLADTGLYTGGAGTLYTIALLFHRLAHMIGDRRTMNLETDRFILAGQIAVLVSARMDMQKMFASTEKTETFLKKIS